MTIKSQTVIQDAAKPLFYADELEPRVAQTMKEIMDDVASGQVPHDIDSFDRLHEYVDANTYGDLCGPDCPVDSPHWDDWVDLANALQAAVNVWLATKPFTPDIDRSDCCGARATYMDDGTGGWALSCKKCYGDCNLADPIVKGAHGHICGGCKATMALCPDPEEEGGCERSLFGILCANCDGG